MQPARLDPVANARRPGYPPVRHLLTSHSLNPSRLGGKRRKLDRKIGSWRIRVAASARWDSERPARVGGASSGLIQRTKKEPPGRRSLSQHAPAIRTGVDGTPIVVSVGKDERTRGRRRALRHVRVLVTNAPPVSVTVASLDMLSGGGARVDQLFRRRRLQAATSWPAANRPKTRLGPFTLGVASIDLTFADPNALPTRVKHSSRSTCRPGLPIPSIILKPAQSSVLRRLAASRARPATDVARRSAQLRWTFSHQAIAWTSPR
jgi:hypothetical protein